MTACLEWDKMRDMDILTSAIRAAGGVSALARHVGVKPNTVSNWQTRGLPRAYAKLFELMQSQGVGVFAVTNGIGHVSNIGSSQQIAR